MGNEATRAPRASQRERVYKKREEITALLADGLTFEKVRDQVGLRDMPISSFHRHAARIASMASSASVHSISDERVQTASPPSPAPAIEPGEGRPTRNKIRKGFKQARDTSQRDLGLDPSEWKANS